MEFYDWKKTLDYNRNFDFIIRVNGYGKTYGMHDWEKKKTLKEGAKDGILRLENDT